MESTLQPREIGRRAASAEGTQEALEGELGSLGTLVPFDLAVVWLACDDLLVARAQSPGALSPAGVSLPRSQWPEAGAVLETGRPQAFQRDGGEDPPADPFALQGARSWVLAPLMLGGAPIGVLSVARACAEPFEAAAVGAVEVYARLLATAACTVVQAMAILRLKSDGEERVSLLEAELGGETDTVLEASLCPAVQDVAWKARQVAPTDTPVLILGETGTGKEWLARAVHRWSSRTGHPFVKINCAAIAAGVLESELFGHVKGAFTGALRDRPGRFQIADRGTLLLDEVGEIPMDLQAKLLRVLQEGTLFPVGSDRQVTVDVRILASTHVDLERAIVAGTFREDLYYRLSVFPLKLPPLRERPDDLPWLCEVLLLAQAARTGRRGMKVSPEGLEKLRGHAWPGNLRELANVLERATILSPHRELEPRFLDLPACACPAPEPAPRASPPPEAAAVLTMDEAQRLHIQRALSACGERIYGEHGAAALLGMKPSTLQSRMKKLGIGRTALWGGEGRDYGEVPTATDGAT
jgi:transcriptional regulator with GAF, ATPase, and Fis domain